MHNSVFIMDSLPPPILLMASTHFHFFFTNFYPYFLQENKSEAELFFEALWLLGNMYIYMLKIVFHLSLKIIYATNKTQNIVNSP